jgi:hypothetical protein
LVTHRLACGVRGPESKSKDVGRRAPDAARIWNAGGPVPNGVS